MCGIGGCVDFNHGIDPITLGRMTEVLARRGPDAQGTFVDGPCGLAHTRLSIIDPNGSAQPMTSSSEAGMTMVYNGELYNYRALRAALLADGVAFDSNGDSEVVLRSVEREWDACLPKLDAMFAFAVWDPKRQRLLIARDALGEKPLFYATPAPGVLVFGSEVKALLAHPAVGRELNFDALRQALRFRAVYGAQALHEGVRQLEPGCWLEFSREGLKLGRFQDLIADTKVAKAAWSGHSDKNLIEEGRQLFMRSVEERLVADVPVGAFLSGGLDSSLIVCAMRKLRPAGEKILTYSVGFEGDPHSELPFAQMVADAIGADHTPITVGPEAYLRRFAELSEARDGPVSQPADIAIAEMSHVAKQQVKVALSGEGADEVFAGYPKYGYAAAPWMLRRSMALVGAHKIAAIAGAVGIDRRRAFVAARALTQGSELGRLVQWFSYFDRAELMRLLPGLDWTPEAWNATVQGQAEALAMIDDSDPLVRMQTCDCLTWLPGNMLERGDRMTMAEGLEVRPPFLDKELVAFGLALPARLKVKNLVGKWIVRHWAAELIPPQVIDRPKWGFRVPLVHWFRGPLREFLQSYLTASGGLCGRYGDPRAISALIERHQAGEDLSEALWALLSVEVWYQDVYLRRIAERASEPAAVNY